MKKIVLAVLASLAFAVPSLHAQPVAIDPATEAAVKDLLATMRVRDMMQQSMQQMNAAMPKIMLQGASAAINSNAKLSPEQKKAALAKAESEIPKAASTFTQMLSDPKLYDELIAETIPLYARRFTAAEIREVIVFYKSPVGAKMLATMPQLMSESMAISQRVMMPRVNAEIQKLSNTK